VNIMSGKARKIASISSASATEPADFNRRLGAVLFGERGDHLGQAAATVSINLNQGDRQHDFSSWNSWHARIRGGYPRADH
jgi:hypothetical protein